MPALLSARRTLSQEDGQNAVCGARPQAPGTPATASRGLPSGGSCRFCDLAAAYFPQSPSRRAASVRLSRWIKADRALFLALTAAGWRSGNRVLTPRQRRAFESVMGRP